MRVASTLLSLTLAASLSGCPSLTAVSDAGEAVDAGRSGVDAGGAPDAGGSADAGLTGDAGADDAGAIDAGPADGGLADAGRADAGLTGDAGAGDAGAGGADAGPVDAGVDAGLPPLPWTFAPGTVNPAWLAAPPSCNELDWTNKYFTYRRRYVGDGTAANPGFISAGTGVGDSMPASTRDPRANCADDWRVSGCTRLGIPQTRGVYTYGDTTIWLGWHLLGLATEHAVFSRLGLPTTQTRQDLYEALVSFNRLDTSAEQHLGYPAALDGFFLRVDVPGTYVYRNNSSGALRWPRNDNGYTGYGCIGAGPACQPESVADGDFVSQDQVIGMLFGAAFVLKYVPPGTVVNGLDLRQETRAIVHRMVKHLRDNSWRVTGPDGTHPPDAWGGNALGFSDQLAKAANRMAAPDFGVSDYQNALSLSAGTSGLTGADASWALQNSVNQSLAIKVAVLNNEWDQAKTAQRAGSIQDPMMAVLHALLWDVPLDPSISPWELESQLTKAPCTGPCADTDTCANAPGWMGPHRLKNPENRAGDINGNNGEFNGSDYLLMHNLYYLVKDGRPTVTPARAPAACTPAQAPGAFIGVSSPATTTYDPRAACAALDMSKRFCGRSFAAWLEAAYRGEVTLFTGAARWSCTNPSQPCTLAPHTGVGTAGADLFVGTAGVDAFSGGEGNDCLVGMGGDDDLVGGPGRDELWGGDGNDRLCGEACALVEVSGDADQLFGEAGNDTLEGGPSSDELYGGLDNDTLDGNAGEDFLYGGAGNDVLRGGDSRDICLGEDGDDALYGEAGDDRLVGGLGRDRIKGGEGADSLVGGEGDDFLMGENGDDTLWGENGNDRLCGGCGDDRLNGGWSSLDACRATAISLICLNPDNPNFIEAGSCGSATLSNAQCDDPAFDAW